MKPIEFSVITKGIYRDINGDGSDWSIGSDLNELFAVQVARFPEKKAVVCGENYLTYRELDQRSNVLAQLLCQRGARKGSYIGICLSRSLALIEVILAISKCGAVYVPVEKQWPQERLQRIFSEIELDIIVTDGSGLPEQITRGLTVVDPAEVDRSVEAEAISVSVEADDPIYVNFTSGATGELKAVPICHRGVVRLANSPRYLKDPTNITTLHLASIACDAATFEIWVPLLTGGTCVVFTQTVMHLTELKHELVNQQVNTIFLTSALFNSIVDVAPECLASVDTILTGGEFHSVRFITKAVDYYGPGRIVSLYGPTECTTFATFYPVNSVFPSQHCIPLGRPIQSTGLYLLNGDVACDIGETGTIHLSGPGLSPGYLFNSALNKKHFKRRLINGREVCLYDTGDKARLLPDLNVVFGR
ncbi:MAG: AMP-binding protein [Reinekea sp.]